MSIQSIAAPLGWMVIGGIIAFVIVFAAAFSKCNEDDELYDED